jgi:hypothetical protein
MARGLMLNDQVADAVVCGATIEAAMRGRRSIRAFAPMPMPRSTILDVVACGTQRHPHQPWQVIAGGPGNKRL